MALDVAEYLNDLGVGAIYASPIFPARRGSPHFYDIVCHDALNPELGSEEDFRELRGRLQSLGMLWLQDIVPNHMAYSQENPLLMDLFENGRESEYFGFFDIEWENPFTCTWVGYLLHSSANPTGRHSKAVR
ncbi:MAG: alpha-amylase family glycosyl hydrolase, partial [Candidatus Methanosuratincola sp.]